MRSSPILNSARVTINSATPAWTRPMGRAQAARDAVVYALPDGGADAVAIIQEGTMVYVKAYNDEWARIASIGGLRSGYVLKAHLRLIS